MRTINSLINEFKKKRILIVGEISSAKSSEFKTGNGGPPVASAALAAIYAAKLGAIVSLTGTVGADTAGSHIINELRENKVSIDGIILDPLKATLCWKKLHKGKEQTPYNLITEKQIIEQSLKNALNSRAILYMCQNPASFNPKIYKELKKISEGLKIPLAIFASLDSWKPLAKTKKNALFIAHAGAKQRLRKELCSKTSSEDCLIINKNGEFNMINKKQVRHYKIGKSIKPYEHEAVISALATLLLACNKYPSGYAELAKNTTVKKSKISISIPAAVASSK